MGLLLGLGVGLGLLLIWRAGSPSLAGETRARPRWTRRLAEQLERAGLTSISPGQLVAICAASAGSVLLLMQVISGTLPVALAFAAIAGWLPISYVAGRGARRSRELAHVWPDVVDNLASAVRAGLSLAEALAQLGERGPDQLRPAFAEFARDYQTSGRFGDCLDRLKARLADPVGDRVIEGLGIARDVGGGDLGRLLRNLSAHLREDARTRAELEARQSWGVAAARLAVAAPWLVLLMLSFQQDVIARYASATGVLILGIGGGLCVLAYVLMRRIGRLPHERRVFA